MYTVISPQDFSGHGNAKQEIPQYFPIRNSSMNLIFQTFLLPPACTSFSMCTCASNEYWNPETENIMSVTAVEAVDGT